MTTLPEIWVCSRPSQPDQTLAEQALGSEWRVDPSATAAENVIEFAGRICYLSFGDRQSPRSNCEYIRNLILQGHDSVLEHATWTFLATNISRALSHQIVRHRIGFSYSQLSQQYVDHGTVEFVLSIESGGDPLVRERIEKHFSAARELYADLLADSPRGNTREEVRAKRSLARSVLPNATETKLVFSANARALRHFLKVRGSTEGDLEMRGFSAALLRLLCSEAPAVFSDFEQSIADDGWPIVNFRPDNPQQ